MRRVWSLVAFGILGLLPAAATVHSHPSAVYFERYSCAVGPSEKVMLNVEWVRPLLEHPEWENVVVHGHADEEGSPAEMLELSRCRAEAVVRALTELGVDGKRLRFAAHGDSMQAMTEPGEAAAKWNRRCDFSFGPDAN